MEKNKEKLHNIPKMKKAARGRSAFFPELEKHLNEWVLECKQNGFIVTRICIKLRALQLLKQDLFKSMKPTMFIALLVGIHDL